MFPNLSFSLIFSILVGFILIVSIYLVFEFVGFEALLAVLLYILCVRFIIPNPMLFASLLALKFLPAMIRNEVSVRNTYQVKEPFIHWAELYPQLQSGDIIEFERKFNYFKLLPASIEPYFEHFARKLTHWGIYASDNTVYHLITSGKSGNGMAAVLADSLRDASHNGKCRINNLEKLAQKHGYLRLPIDEIFRLARSYMMKGEFRYDGLTNNCEHFATLCVYNVPFSTQSDHIYNHYSKQFFIDFIAIFIPHMIAYYIWNIQWIQNGVNLIYSKHVKVITKVVDILQTFANIVEQNENAVTFALVAIGTPWACWWFGFFE